MSTLSVEISTIVSSAAMVSPTFLAQRVIVPSDTLTPIWGITTSTRIPVVMANQLLIAGKLVDGCQDVFHLGKEGLLQRW